MFRQVVGFADPRHENDASDSRARSACLAVIAIMAASIGATLFVSSCVLLANDCNTVDDDARVVGVSDLLGDATSCQIDFYFAGGAANGSLVAPCNATGNDTTTVAVCYDGQDPRGHASVVRASLEPALLAFRGYIPLMTVINMLYAGVAFVGAATLSGFASLALTVGRCHRLPLT